MTRVSATPVRRPAVGGPDDGPERLQATARRLRDTGVLELRVDPVVGTGWSTLTSSLRDLRSRHDGLTARDGDRRAAAAYLAGWVARTPALVVGLPAVLGGVTPVVDADAIRLHPTAEGWFDRYALTGPVRVATEGCLDEAAAIIARISTPIVEILCAELPVGPVAVWGGVADSLGAYALWFARETGLDGGAVWADVGELLDRLRRHVPFRYGPRLLPVAWSGGVAHFQLRGTCCLYYRTCAAPAGDDRYCTSCPLRTETDRTARLVAHLEST